ncbi:hypothetical protein NFI96_006295 [Prochilodus magdalenae]|nr:hypothetical protein NFI96_006295 [Prochilodus magdalenae]
MAKTTELLKDTRKKTVDLHQAGKSESTMAPDANANSTLKELHDNISSLQNKHPEAFYVVAGDFNHVNLTNSLPRFYQHINIPTWGNNTLDRVYTNIRDPYRAVPHPHLGLSDHISIMLVPAYHPPLRRSRPTQKTITVWPGDADTVPQDCFGCTDWQVFREAAESEGELDLEDYTSAVLGYISKCVEVKMIMRTVSKNSRITRRDLMNDPQRAGTKVTKATISNTLHREGLTSCNARHVPLLKPVHVLARLKFAREHMDDPEEEWENIMWPDETKIELSGKNLTCRVWRKKKAELHPKKTIPTEKHGGGDIMLWGWTTDPC